MTMNSDNWCKHYNGMMNKVCDAGGQIFLHDGRALVISQVDDLLAQQTHFSELDGQI